MTMLDAVEPKDILTPEVAYRCGFIDEKHYDILKELEMLRILDGR